MKRRAFLFILALMLCCALSITAYASEDSAKLSVAVEALTPTELSANDMITVFVAVKENTGNLGLSLDLKWDPAVLDYVSKDLSVSEFNESDAVAQKKFNRVVITVGNPSMGFQFPDRADEVLGTGKIVALTFKAKELCTDISSALTIARYSYCNYRGEKIEDIQVNHLDFSVYGDDRYHMSQTEASCTADKVCDACGYVMEKAAGHHPGTAATCTVPQTCTACGEELAAATGHEETIDEAKLPTCTAAGLTEGMHCAKCGEVLMKQEIVPAAGHTPFDGWVNTDEAGHWYACKICGEKLSFAAHTLDGSVCSVCGYGCRHTGGAATCTSKAVCTICGNEYGDLAPHDLAQLAAKTPTCGASGWNAYEKCAICEYTTYEELPAAGVHTFGEWETVKEATTKETGEQKRTCSVCGATEAQDLPMLEAQFPWWIIVAVLVAGGAAAAIMVKKKTA